MSAPDTITVPRGLFASLLDSDACWFDHHGGCQAHGYLSLGPGEVCPIEDSKRRLAANQASPPASAEILVRAKYDEKDAKWKVLAEMPNGDAFVTEDRLFGKALAQVTLRIEEGSQ